MEISAFTTALSALYESCGYAQYKMEKFEEYDLYARNREFLSSAAFITFTDTDGRLKALKPDVTLSIIQHSDVRKGRLRLYYAENVYRIGPSGAYSEIPQVGLETIGAIDTTALVEVIQLAADTLSVLAGREENAVLDVSHLGILLQALKKIRVPEKEQYGILELIGKKNLHEAAGLLASLGVSAEDIGTFTALASLEGTPDAVLPELADICRRLAIDDCGFAGVMEAVGLSSPRARIDFSSVGDPRYYNGFVLRGYVRSVPGSVLSGGQYDGLMRRMKKTSGGLGFAVYTDMLESLADGSQRYDADCALVYTEEDPVRDVVALARSLRKRGERVLLCRPEELESLRVKRVTDLRGEKTEEAPC